MIPSFVLKRPSSEGQTSVIMLIKCTDGRLKYYTGLSTFPDEFATDTHIQHTISSIKKELKLLVQDLRLRGEPFTKDAVKNRLNNFLQKETGASDYFTRMKDIINKMESGVIVTPQKKKYSPLSIKTFRFTQTLLESFDSKMTLGSITMDTYNRFITWCHGKQYSTNYIGSQIKNWKSLTGQIGKNAAVESGAFKKLSEDALDVYLNEKEIEKIYSQNGSARENLARDWFILNCFCGLRVSDLTILEKKNLSKDYITIANEKTDAKVVIPLHPMARKIIEKYKGFPPKITDVEINREIKIVAANAGITNKVLHVITKGGKRKDSYLVKADMISSHTSRRSFITNLLKRGVPDTIVMKLTGIKSAQTLSRYNKLSSDEAAEIAAGLDFFK